MVRWQQFANIDDVWFWNVDISFFLTFFVPPVVMVIWGRPLGVGPHGPNGTNPYQPCCIYGGANDLQAINIQYVFGLDWFVGAGPPIRNIFLLYIIQYHRGWWGWQPTPQLYIYIFFSFLNTSG